MGRLPLYFIFKTRVESMYGSTFGKTVIVVGRILYRDTKPMDPSLDGNTDLFEIVAEILQGDTLVQFLFIICLDYKLQTSIDLTEKKEKKKKKEKKQVAYDIL